METLIDSYSETNSNSIWANKPEISYGQSFTGNGSILTTSKFYLQKIGSPTGTAYVKIYAHTGTFGTNGVPTGSAIATSNGIDVSSISTTVSLVTFTFSGVNAITLENNTKYFIVWNFADVGYPTNYISVGQDTSSPTHAGNSAYSVDNTTWTNYTPDICFYVYGIINSDKFFQLF